MNIYLYRLKEIRHNIENEQSFNYFIERLKIFIIVIGLVSDEIQNRNSRVPSERNQSHVKQRFPLAVGTNDNPIHEFTFLWMIWLLLFLGISLIVFIILLDEQLGIIGCLFSFFRHLNIYLRKVVINLIIINYRLNFS